MARRVSKPAAPTSVEAVRHTGDSRVNIPTAELGSLAEARRPGRRRCAIRATRRSTRSSSGRARTSRTARTSSCRRCRSTSRSRSARRRSSRTCGRRPRPAATRSSTSSHSDFNGMAFEERVDFYRHPMKWSNRMILGDSLLVMSSLAEKEGLKGQVQSHLPRPALRDQVRQQLAGLDAQARRQGRQGRGRHPPARAGPRLPRHLGARHPLVPELPARPARRRPRAADRVWLDLRPDRRRERASRPERCSTRCSAPRTSSRRSPSRRRAGSSACTTSLARRDYLVWYARDSGRVKYRQL